MGSLEGSSLEQLIEECILAKERAYCPYSKFRVGCALLTDDGQIFTGCNVENASYGLTICAERTAIPKAVSEGYRKFTHIAVSSDIDGYLAPCGACRQFIAEFSMDCQVILIRNKTDYKIIPMKEVLPFAFQKENLDLSPAK